MRIPAVVLGLFLIFMSACSLLPEDRNRLVTPLAPKVIRKPGSVIHHVSSFGRVVRLETVNDALIGSVDGVQIDPNNGDILVMDRRAAETVLRFDGNGRFIRRYGRNGEGPGEYQHVFDFDIDADGSVVVVGNNKLIRYARNGDTREEAPLLAVLHQIEQIKAVYYVTTLTELNQLDGCVLVYDQQLLRMKEFGPRSLRHPRLSLVPERYMTTDGESLYLAGFWEPTLYQYGPEGHLHRVVKFPNLGEDVSERLENRGFDQKDEAYVNGHLHHFNVILANSDYIYLHEVMSQFKDRRSALYFPKTNDYFVFDGDRQHAPSEGPFFDQVVGTWSEGLILSLSEMGEIQKLRQYYPQIYALELAAVDNPLLLFIKLNREQLYP